MYNLLKPYFFSHFLTLKFFFKIQVYFITLYKKNFNKKLDKLFSNETGGKSQSSSLDDGVSHKRTHLRLGFFIFILDQKRNKSSILFYFLPLLNYKYKMNDSVENLFLSHHLRHSYGP